MKFIETIRDYIDKTVVAYRGVVTLTALYVATGDEIDVTNYKTLTIYPKWVKGDETSAQIQIAELYATGGTEHVIGAYTNSTGILSVEPWTYTYITSSQSGVPISIDVTGKKFIKIYTKATGGTPTGSMKIDYIKSNVI